MKLNLFTLLPVLMGFSISSFSGDINCSGNITSLMADHGGCIDTSGKRQMAFKTRGPWMCARTEMGSSMLLAAKAAERSVNVYITDGNVGNTCSSIPKYTKVSYIILN